MGELTAFAAPGHNGWDAMIVLALVCGVGFLGWLGKRGQDQYRDTRADHLEVVKSGISAEQAHAIAAMGPVPPPKTMGLLLALLVGGLVLAGGARHYFADASKECRPACDSAQVCRNGVCTGSADARILSMMLPGGAALREVPGNEDTSGRSPFPDRAQDPAVIEINFGVKR